MLDCIKCARCCGLSAVGKLLTGRRTLRPGCLLQALLILWRTIEDHDTLFVLAEIAHFVGIGLLAFKMYSKRSAAGGQDGNSQLLGLPNEKQADMSRQWLHQKAVVSAMIDTNSTVTEEEAATTTAAAAGSAAASRLVGTYHLTCSCLLM